MPASVIVVARFIAKPGKQDQLRGVLEKLIAPTRRELGCYAFDLMANSTEPRELLLYEKWDGHKALDHHLDASYVQSAMPVIEDLVEEPPDIRRYVFS